MILYYHSHLSSKILSFLLSTGQMLVLDGFSYNLVTACGEDKIDTD